jgi:hypothetical protein
MRSATCAIGVALALAALTARPGAARADGATPWTYRAVIDRIDLEPASIGGLRLRIFLSALELSGQRADVERGDLKTQVGNGKLDAPFALGSYAPPPGATASQVAAQASYDTAIVLVVQANQAFADTLGAIESALDDSLLGALNDRTQLAILPYGSATGTGKLGSLKSMRGKLGEIAQDGSAGEPALLDTLDRALLLLRKAKSSPAGRPLRKLIVVIGDGRDRSGDRDRVSKLGARADKAGVRIDCFGYAPSELRRPLLTLGELAKQSRGAFRWVRSGSAESWRPAFLQLRDEINQQYVVTYFLPGDTEVAGKKLKITLARLNVTSNELTVPAAACGADASCTGYCVDGVCTTPLQTSGRGILGWILLVVGSLVGIAVALGVIGYFLQRRQQPVQPSPFPPGYVAGQPLPPGFVPPGSKPPKAKRGKQPVAPIAPPPPVTGPALLIMTGPRTGQRVPLQNGFTIGKAPTSNLVLDVGYTSSQHAQIGVDAGGRCRLYDRNSTNGTYVNGVRVTEVVLDDGMSVRIGSTELRFTAQ